MKRFLSATCVAMVLLLFSGCEVEQNDTQVSLAEENNTDAEEGIDLIYAHIGENLIEITPADNSSAEAFLELLKQDDVTVEMHDYGGFEKVGSLATSLPTNDESITTEPGDVILYQGNSITIYYDTNTWSFTRLGKVQDRSQEELKEVLGEGDVSVTFSLRK
ncbi:MAG: cyclophilin-like fold protein [Lachnospiraceae bacterium]